MIFSLKVTSFSKKNLQKIILELNNQKFLPKNKLFISNRHFKLAHNRYTLLTSTNGDKNTGKATFENCTYSHIIFIYLKNLQKFLDIIKVIKMGGTSIQIFTLLK